tara:strand:- start:388 stop:864 length:477 start_codon:yes stop_codon:yes gene_type:complete
MLKYLKLLLLIILLNSNFVNAQSNEVILSEKGLNFKNPQILYKDKNSKMASAYLEIENTNNFNEKLLYVTGDISNNIQIHNTKMIDGVMKMYEVKNGIDINKSSRFIFEPGKYHIMIMGINQTFSEDNYNLNLVFKESKIISINFEALSYEKKLKMAH